MIPPDFLISSGDKTQNFVHFWTWHELTHNQDTLSGKRCSGAFQTAAPPVNCRGVPLYAFRRVFHHAGVVIIKQATADRGYGYDIADIS